MRSAVLSLCALSIMTLPAMSQTLPRLDPEGSCRAEWTKGGVVDNQMVAYCLRNEQSAYNNLKTLWPTYSDNVRAVCSSEWGTLPKGTYSMLQYCTKNQVEAERSNSGGSFKW